MQRRKKTDGINTSSRGSVFSFFSGAGFLDLGFEKGGFEIVFVNELHEPFLKAHKHARGGMGLKDPRYGYNHGDMGALTEGNGKKKLSTFLSDAKKRGEITGFIGGPPCPDFSVAGKNRGSRGQHGKLSGIYTKLIKQQKPDFFVFENVKGLYKTELHRKYYDNLKKQLRANGYVTTERLINALEYGVAQDRARIILVGFKKELLPMEDPEVAKQFLEDYFPWWGSKKYSLDQIKPTTKQVKVKKMPEEVTVNFWFKKNDVLNHPNSKHHFQPQVIQKFRTIKEGDVSKKSFKRLHRDRYSPTAAYGNNEVHLHPFRPRRISAAEALAIQSLPKNFSFPSDMTLSDMFKAIGNGVPFIAARAVAKDVANFLAIKDSLLPKG
jgi:DNA (cytosine-5)-methyltransferase 1